MTSPVDEAPLAPGREASVATLLWIGIGSLFVLVRLAGVLSIPVGGAELDHLAGAWQAHAGNNDVRYLPTLFQGLTAWLFNFTESEAPARMLVLFTSASVPVALFRLRRVFGEAPALFTLILLTLDPVSILLGSTAWAGAFDIAVVLWLAVALHERNLPRFAYVAAGFAVATAGSLVLPVVVATTVLRLLSQRYPTRGAVAFVAIGVLLGLALSSVGFGFGWEGPTAPPIAAFAAGFERPWSSEHTRFLALLYSAPILAGGFAAAIASGYRSWRDQEWSESQTLLYAWAGVGTAWLVVAGGSHDPSAVAAVTLPFAFILAAELPGAYSALHRVDWRWASPVLGVLVLSALIAEAYVADWARTDRVGTSDDKLIVAGLVISTVACLGVLASNRKTLPAVVLFPALVGLFVLLSGASAVAFGGPNEPLPSPISSVQGREIRDIARELQAEKGGLIVVHSQFDEAMTWPFRDSGTIVLASRVPPDAIAVVWPASEAAPEGFGVVEGEWSLVEARRGPDGGFLGYLRWLTNRNSLKNGRVPVAVYLRAGQ